MIKKLKQIFSFQVTVIIIAAVIFNIMYYKFIYSMLIDLTDLYVSNSLSAGIAAVENSIDQKLNEVRLLAKIYNLSDESIPIEQKLAELTAFKENERRLRFYYILVDGTGYSNYNEVVHFQEYPFFKQTLHGATTISEPIYDYNEKNWVTVVSSPIRGSEGRIIGVLAALYDANELKQLINGINIGESTMNLIYTDKGTVVTSNSSEIMNAVTYTGAIDRRLSELKSLSDFMKNAAELGKGSDEFSFDGRMYFGVYDTLQNNNWILTISAPKNILFFEIYILTGGIALVTVCVVFITIFMAIYSDMLNKNLKAEKKKNVTVINSSNVLILNLLDNGIITSCNGNFALATGYSLFEISNMSIYDLIPENYRTDFEVYIDRVKHGGNMNEADIPVIGKNGRKVYVLWNSNSVDTSKNKKNKSLELIGTNITKLKEYERKMQRLAYFDQLTGIYNAAYIEEFFNSICTSIQLNRKIALIYLDIDNFKYINDMFGHSTGDKFLIDVCSRVAKIEDSSVKVCRRGGDELILLYYNFGEDRESFYDYINQLYRLIREDYYINSIKYNITASIGVSIYPDDAEAYSELFKCAEIAMNSAKESGKDKIQFFNNEMKNEIYERIMIENDLKAAVENKEFILYYQPQYDMKTGELYGFEALIRWISPARGFVSPNKFIPQAEKNQMIIEIGSWALETACDFINEVSELGYEDICVSVNVSVVQMMCDDYVEKTLNIIKRKNINHKNLKLEITESVLMESIDEMLEKIKKLNKQGIYFSLDDFGTGYSSLTYLKTIPLKVLKIDKSFVDTIIDEDGNKEILSSIIDLAHDIHLDVVAEGIEEYIQLEWLRNKGCNIAQGFYMGKPMPREKALDELGKNMYKAG